MKQSFKEEMTTKSNSNNQIVEGETTFRKVIWPKLKHFLAGSFSGVALILVGHPFDTIKVRLQNEGSLGKFKGPLDCLIQTIKNEKIRGLYKGALLPMVTYGFINSIMFGIMEFCKDNKRKKSKNQELTVPQVMGCATITGLFFLPFIVTPIEHIKAK